MANIQKNVQMDFRQTFTFRNKTSRITQKRRKDRVLVPAQLK